MKAIAFPCLAGLFAATTAVVAVHNRALRADLAEARAALSALPTSPVVVASPAETRVVEVSAKLPDPDAKSAAGDKAPASEPAAVDGAALEKAVQERVAAIEREREAERERRRREWENESPEQRAERRREFQARMQERAQRRLAEFIEKTGLDETQSLALEGELTMFNDRVRESAEAWAAAIRESGSFGPETRTQLFADMCGVVLDTYAGLDETLPENWRENDGNFDVVEMVDFTSMEPLLEALRETGAFPPMGPMGFMGGRPPRGRRGPGANAPAAPPPEN